MGVIISIFQWIWKLLDTALRWASELPGKLTLFVTTFLATIAGVISFFASNISSIVTMLNTATGHVNTVTAAIGQSSWGSLLVYCFSLDVAAQYVVSVGGVFLGAVSMVFLALFGYAITCWVIPMALLLVQKLISVFSGGFIKT